MEEIEVNRKKIKLDDGYLDDERQWTKDVAIYFAKNDGVKLIDRHWEIINLIRDYYQKFQITPFLKIFMRMLRDKYGQNFSTNDLWQLFPKGYKMVIKYSGLRRYG